MNDPIQTQINNSTLNNSIFNYHDKKIKKLLGDIPIYPEVFIGRDDDLDNIHEKLFNQQNCLLLVNGEGGIGKTTIASTYYHKYIEKYSHLIWLVVDSSIEDALLFLGIELQLEVDKTLTKKQNIDRILHELLELKTPSLLVLDNANKLEELENSYPLLRKCSNLHILITTRITEFAQAAIYKIDSLDQPKAHQLFISHYSSHDSSDDKLLDAIMDAVGYNTLVIELLAKNLNNFNNILHKEYPLHNLLKDLQTKGILEISKTKKITTDYHHFTAVKPETIINAMYDISKLQETEQTLLAIFSILPSKNIPFDHLKDLLPEIENLDKLALSIAQKGWIEFNQEQKSFKCNQLIGEIARKQNSEKLFNHCQPFVKALINKLDYEPQTGTLSNISHAQALAFIQYAEIVCQYLSDKYNAKDIMGYLLDRLGNFHKNYGNLVKALSFFEEFTLLMKELSNTNKHNIDIKNGLAISYSKLGETYSMFGDLDKALNFFEESAKLMKELFDTNKNNIGFKNRLAISYSKLGKTYSMFGDLYKALSFFEKYAFFMKELSNTNRNNIRFKSGLATSYSKLGESHSLLGNLDKALRFFEKSAFLMKELFKDNKNNVGLKNGLAISYEKLGDVHTMLGNLDKALRFFENFTQLMKELFEENKNNIKFKNGLAISYEKLGNTHFTLGNMIKALSFFEKRSKLGKELFKENQNNVEFKNGLAISYEKQGEIHSTLGNLDKALNFFEDEMQLFGELFDINKSNAGFKNGLAISFSKLGETHLMLGNLEKALSFFEEFARLMEELFEENKNNIGFKNSLAVSYSKLGDTHSVLGNLDKALSFFEYEITSFEELFRAYPDNIKIRNNLPLSYAKLGVFYRDHKNDKTNACRYFEAAQQLWQELSNQFPNYVEFRKYYQMVNQDLRNLDKL